MDLLKIALLQIAPANSLEENLKKGVAYCKKAKELDADIALFPEMFSNGYNIYNRPVKEWQNEAIAKDSCFVNTFKCLAKELNMARMTFSRHLHSLINSGFIQPRGNLINRYTITDLGIKVVKTKSCIGE